MATQYTRSRPKASLPEDIENLSTLILHEAPVARAAGAKRKSCKKETARVTAQIENSASMEQLINLETLKHQNLKLQLEISRTQVEMRI